MVQSVYIKTMCFCTFFRRTKKEPIRSYIIDLIHNTEDLSDINLIENKPLFDELMILQKNVNIV